MTESNENEIHEEILSKTEKSGESPTPPVSNTTSGRKKGIGKGGYQETVAKIERENKVLLKKFDKIETFLDRFSASPPGGDLTSFVDRGLSSQEPSKVLIPGRDEIARTWESGKHTFEELIADYERLRSQKIWSQEDLEGILIRFETLAGEISRSVLTCQNAIEGILPALSGHSGEKSAERMSREEISRMSREMSEIGGLIAGSREAILGAIGDKNFVPLAPSLTERDQELLSHVLQKIGNIEELLKENRLSPSFEADRSIGSAGLPGQGIRQSLFIKQDPEKNKLTGKTVVTSRIKRLGFWGLMAALAIVAVVARVKYSGPPPSQERTVTNQEVFRPIPVSPPIIQKRQPPEGLQKFQNIEVLSDLDKLREGVGENSQAITDLSGKIDQALSSLPKGASLSTHKKRLINEGQELEWLVKTWPTGPGRKELLRMMGGYAGE